MSRCCCPPKTDVATASRCPVRGSQGAVVDVLTVKALLTESALRRFISGEYRFCPDAGCDVVYFSADGQRFTAADVRVHVRNKAANWHDLRHHAELRIMPRAWATETSALEGHAIRRAGRAA